VTPWVLRLLVANVGAFFLQMTMQGVTSLMMFNASVPGILLRPWTLITYMFMHGGMGHLFFNMLSLYFFGSQVESRLGSRRFITLYVLSGISGAILSFFFSPGSNIIGASGAVFGVMLAFAHFWPREKIFIWGVFPVEARVLVIIMTVMSLLGGSSRAGGIAHFAHLGGYVGAWLYLRWLDARAGTKQFRQKTVAKVPDTTLANWQKVDTRSIHEINREEVNRILDKINQSGLSSLTAQEKQFLSNFVPPDDRVPPVS
jgi:membrane associated rhomboid family serine protease